jgi:hypothetical protein
MFEQKIRGNVSIFILDQIDSAFREVIILSLFWEDYSPFLGKFRLFVFRLTLGIEQFSLSFNTNDEFAIPITSIHTLFLVS